MTSASLWIRGGATVAYAGMIFWLSASPRPLGLDLVLPLGGDKLVHAVEFGLLALLLRWSLDALRGRLTGGVRDLLAVALAGLYGISDELHQLFVPGREASPWDALADLTGALLLVAAARRLGLWRGAHEPGGDHAASLQER